MIEEYPVAFFKNYLLNIPILGIPINIHNSTIVDLHRRNDRIGSGNINYGIKQWKNLLKKL